MRSEAASLSGNYNNLARRHLVREPYYWLKLNSVHGIGRVLFKRLIESLGSPEAVFSAPSSKLKDIDGISERIIKEIENLKADDKKINDELDRIRKEGIRLIALNDNDYPQNLKAIYDPPPYLYVKGDFKNEDRLSVSIVGSRSATNYGRQITETISRELSQIGITIVSGMARGIDSFAHQSTLNSGGRTIAVLGCGIDVVYPPENKGLMARIKDSGAVITEFPFGTLPEATNFPQRNRIISGLSLGTVVIEASDDSGSLITANYTIEQGRELFAVPGNITSRMSKGSNSLIKKGAKLVNSADDIIEELIPQLKGELKNIRSLKDRAIITNLSDEEKMMFNSITFEPKHIDRLTNDSNLPSNKVSALLLNLELKGAVKRLSGNMFIRSC